jgi:hypothetical protein
MKQGRSVIKSVLALAVGWILGTLVSAAQAEEYHSWTESQFEQCQELLVREFSTIAPSPRDEGTARFHCSRARQLGLHHFAYTGCVTDFILQLAMPKYVAAHYCVHPSARDRLTWRRLIVAIQRNFQVDLLNAVALSVRPADQAERISTCADQLAFALVEQREWITSLELEALRPELFRRCRDELTSQERLEGALTCFRRMDTPTVEAFGTEKVIQECLDHADHGYDFSYCFTYGVPFGCTPGRATPQELELFHSYCAAFRYGDPAPKCPGITAAPVRD